jgi:hypothetical protein
MPTPSRAEWCPDRLPPRTGPISTFRHQLALPTSHWASAMGHVWTAPGWQEESSRRSLWSEQPCVRPLSAVPMTAGHNALRGSGPDQKHAFGDAMARVGCPDRRIDRHCITCCSPSQPLRHAGGVRRGVVTPRARRVHCSVHPSPSSPRPSWRACWRARWQRPWPVVAPAAP